MGRKENVAEVYASLSLCPNAEYPPHLQMMPLNKWPSWRFCECGTERWRRAQEKHYCSEEGGVRRGTGSHTHEKKGTLVRRRKLHKLKDQGAQARKQC